MGFLQLPQFRGGLNPLFFVTCFEENTCLNTSIPFAIVPEGRQFLSVQHVTEA